MNSMRRFGIQNPIDFLESMIEYQKTHTTNQTNLIHPLHKTPEEKAEAVKARAKRKRAASRKPK